MNWHFPRTDYAEHILNAMHGGLLSRVTIFAPRKRGKTQFIQRDVMPLCESKGIFVVYVDFWQDKDNPEAVFIQSVIRAIEERKSWLSKVTDIFKPNKIGVSLSKASVDIGLEAKQEQNPYQLFDAFELLNKLNMPTLLCLDEVQHLATRKEFENFTAALRSFMVNRGDDLVKGIFTGSSREGLEKLFRHTKAPFYNSAQSLDFPALDEKFVEFELGVVKKITNGVELNKEDALNTLIEQHREPARFVELLQQMVLNQVVDFSEAMKRFDLVVQSHPQEFQDLFEQLPALDKAVLLLIARGNGKNFYTDKGIRNVKLMLLDDSVNVTKSSINNALRRLKSENLIFNIKRGVMGIENPELEKYLIAVAS
ncbi:hypothetical protein D5018_16515 [Parashewanella curva]|uniref:ATP-binding protein n=1 Tax=Parashewanella curva TaxID=2338552 RepID=A0A3L8PX10_9GAMM|nr:hypothetical protein [Parashewanella curva]RLV58582.1 hypothetical protein D5018_16515 [Parashewanella curva]